MLPPHDGAGGILAQAIVEYAPLNVQTLQDVRDCKLAGCSPPFHLALISSIYFDKWDQKKRGWVCVGSVWSTGDVLSFDCD